MSDRGPDQPKTNIPFAPKPKIGREGNPVADDTGHAIIALLKKAADMAKEDYARAMDVTKSLSFQLRAAEERTREAEAEAAHFRDRATHAETWMLRIREELEQTFFQKKERGSVEGLLPPNSDAPPVARTVDPVAESDRAGRRR
jgi:hypothetical protein